MTNKKRTKKDIFADILQLEEIKTNEEFAKTIQHEIELLERKANRKTTSKKSQADLELMEQIVNALQAEPDKMFTATEVWQKLPKWTEYTNQKITALLGKLITEGKIVNIKDKRKSLFKIAA